MNLLSQTDRHGHITFTVTGRKRCGATEKEALRERGFYMPRDGRNIWTAGGPDNDYDAKHRLWDGSLHRVVLLPGTVISGEERKPDKLDDLAASFGYRKPRAGVVPRIAEVLSKDFLQHFGFEMVIVMHEPIECDKGDFLVMGLWYARGGHDKNHHLDGIEPESWSDKAALAYCCD